MLITKNFVVPMNMWLELQEMAKARDTTISKLVVEAVKEWLNKNREEQA